MACNPGGNPNMTFVINLFNKAPCVEPAPCITGEGPGGVASKRGVDGQPSYFSGVEDEIPEIQLPDITDPRCDPDNPVVVTLEDVTNAYPVVQPNIVRTPLKKSRLGEQLEMELYFKNEFLQYTGNFKERGANYALSKLKEKNPGTAGAVSASAGNHASAMAYHGKLLNIPITVVMPVTAPLMKRKLCEDLGAQVLMYGRCLSDSKKYGLKYAKDNGMEYINGYDHPDVLAGAGTCALEVLEDLPDIDAIIVPIGGGGLLAGTCTFMKGQPDRKPMVIGVETDMCPGFTEALKMGKPTFAEPEPTIAEGLQVPLVGYNSYATAAPLLDEVIVVEEQWINLAILRLVEVEKAVVEGAGAVGLAAMLSGQLDKLKGLKVVVVLSGGNIDTTVLGRVLERGLAADGRLIWFSVMIQDKPTQLPELLMVIGGIGANIVQLEEDRAFVQKNIWNVQVKVKCEVTGDQMTDALTDALTQKYGSNFAMLQKPKLVASE